MRALSCGLRSAALLGCRRHAARQRFHELLTGAWKVLCVALHRPHGSATEAQALCTSGAAAQAQGVDGDYEATVRVLERMLGV